MKRSFAQPLPIGASRDSKKKVKRSSGDAHPASSGDAHPVDSAVLVTNALTGVMADVSSVMPAAHQVPLTERQALTQERKKVMRAAGFGSTLHSLVRTYIALLKRTFAEQWNAETPPAQS